MNPRLAITALAGFGRRRLWSGATDERAHPSPDRLVHLGISIAFTALALPFVASSFAARGIEASVDDVVFEMAMLAFSTLGVLVAGAVTSVGEASYRYANYSLLTAPGTLPTGGRWPGSGLGFRPREDP